VVTPPVPPVPPTPPVKHREIKSCDNGVLLVQNQSFIDGEWQNVGPVIAVADTAECKQDFGPKTVPHTRTTSQCLGESLVIKTETYVDGEWQTTESSTYNGAKACQRTAKQPPVIEEGM